MKGANESLRVRSEPDTYAKAGSVDPPLAEMAQADASFVSEENNADMKAVRLVNSSSREDCLRQVEYYFCDENLPFDDFLLSHSDESGAIECSVLANANRIKYYLPALSPKQRALLLYDAAADSDSIKRVPPSKLVRLRPLPADDPAIRRSVHVKFPRKVKPPDLGLPCRRLRDLRESRDFTGAVVFEFESTEAAQDFVAKTGEEIKSVPASEVKLMSEITRETAERKRTGHTVLSFRGARRGLDRETIRAACLPGLVFVDYERGDDTGHLRFMSARDATRALELVADWPETFQLLDEFQRTHYWQLFADRRKHTVKRQLEAYSPGRGAPRGFRAWRRGRGQGAAKRGRGLAVPQN